MEAMTQGNEHYLIGWIGAVAIILIIAVCWTVASVKNRVNEPEDQDKKNEG